MGKQHRQRQRQVATITMPVYKLPRLRDDTTDQAKRLLTQLQAALAILEGRRRVETEYRMSELEAWLVDKTPLLAEGTFDRVPCSCKSAAIDRCAYCHTLICVVHSIRGRDGQRYCEDHRPTYLWQGGQP